MNWTAKKTMKVFGIFILLFASLASGISGIIDSSNNHWGEGGNVASPILLTGSVSVLGGTTLIIEPGCEIDFGYDGRTIACSDKGRIEARGTSEDWILFHRRGTANSLYFSDSSFGDLRHMRYDAGDIGVRSEAQVTIQNSLLVNCLVVVDNAKLRFVNNSCYGNNSAFVGINSLPQELLLLNNIFVQQGISAISCLIENVDLTSMRYNAFFGHTKTSVNECDIHMSVDNMFLVENPFQDAPGSNFHIKQTSPTIDAGDPTDDYSLEPDCNVKNTRINMGAYGNTPEAACKADIGVVMPFASRKLQNPSTASVMYDIRGRRVSPTGFAGGVRIIQAEGAAKRYRAKVHFQAVGAGH